MALTKEEIQEMEREVFAAVRKHIDEEKAAGRDPDTAALWWGARQYINDEIDASLPRDEYGDWEPVFDGDW